MLSALGKLNYIGSIQPTQCRKWFKFAPTLMETHPFLHGALEAKPTRALPAQPPSLLASQQELPGVGMTKSTSYESHLPGDVHFTVAATEFPRAMVEKTI